MPCKVTLVMDPHISDPIFWEQPTAHLPRLDRKFLPSSGASPTDDSAEPPAMTAEQARLIAEWKPQDVGQK